MDAIIGALRCVRDSAPPPPPETDRGRRIGASNRDPLCDPSQLHSRVCRTYSGGKTTAVAGGCYNNFVVKQLFTHNT